MGASDLEVLRRENQALREKVTSLEKRIQDLERQNAVLKELESRGIADERYFSKRLREAVLSAERYARFLCVVLVDVPQNGDPKRNRDLALETASRLRQAFRKTDLIAFYHSGQVFVLLEEAETYQGIQALKRVQEEIRDIPAPLYSLACYPSDSNRENTLLEILADRMNKLKKIGHQGAMVHFGEEILPLSN